MKFKFKNILSKDLYIFFIFLSLIIFFFSTTKVEGKAFDIDNIEVSKPFEINFDKNKVLDEGFKKAFSELILLIVNSNDQNKINQIKLNEIKGMIESFSIKEEKFINEIYFVNLGVSFNKKKIFNFLEKKNIFPSIPKEKTLLLIPILINNEKKQILLFSENPFYTNWNKSKKKHHLLNYILPNEDIEDINFIKKNINNIEEYNFNEIVSKYEIDNYIILILFQKKNSFNALMKSNLNNKIIISNKKFEWHENQSIENIINNFKLEFENQWKKLNIINVSIKLPITLSVNSKNYKLIKKLDKKLHNLDLVSSFYIDSINSDKLIYKIIYNSTPDKFINEFSNDNIKLNTNESIWRIE